MKEFLGIHFTWWNFFEVAFAFAVLFFVLVQLKRWLALDAFGGMPLKGRWRRNLMEYNRRALMLFEPMAVFVLTSVFIFINPEVHGIFVAILLLAGSHHLQNYINGRVILLNGAVLPGAKLKSGETEGAISHRGRLGIHLRTSKGQVYLPYSKLIDTGFTIVSGVDIGRFCRLKIAARTADKNALNLVKLNDLLAATPYIDWDFKPELANLPEEKPAIEARVLLREDSHLTELIQLIGEWGWDCSIVRKTTMVRRDKRLNNERAQN